MGCSLHVFVFLRIKLTVVIVSLTRVTVSCSQILEGRVYHTLKLGRELAVETVFLVLMIAAPDSVEIDAWQLRLPRIYSGW